MNKGKTVATLLYLYILLFASQAIATSACGYFLNGGQQKLSRLLDANQSSLQEALAVDGPTYHYLPSNQWLSEDFAQWLFERFPRADANHINQSNFELFRGKLLDAESIYMGELFDFDPQAINILSAIGQLAGRHIMDALPTREEIELRNMTVHFRHQGSLNEGYDRDSNFYSPHVDPEPVYIRVLITFKGSGTLFFPEVADGEVKQARIGDIIVFSGTGRQNHLRLKQNLLLHAPPDSAQLDEDRLMVGWDFLIKKPNLFQRCLDQFKCMWE